MFYDLLFLIHNLEKPLSKDDYFNFKHILYKETFPILYDTKLLSIELKMSKLPLEELYN